MSLICELCKQQSIDVMNPFISYIELKKCLEKYQNIDIKMVLDANYCTACAGVILEKIVEPLLINEEKKQCEMCKGHHSIFKQIEYHEFILNICESCYYYMTNNFKSCQGCLSRYKLKDMKYVDGISYGKIKHRHLLCENCLKIYNSYPEDYFKTNTFYSVFKPISELEINELINNNNNNNFNTTSTIIEKIN